MVGPISKVIVLALCLSAFLLVACSQDADKPDRRQTGTASGSDGAATAKVRMLPREGTLSAGRYSTGEGFEPTFSFELGEGWLVLRPSGHRSLKLGYVAPGQEVAQGKGLRFLNVREVFEPHKQGGDVLFEAKPAPKDLVAWLQRHPYLGTEEPEPADVGGVPAKQFGADVAVPEGYRNGCAVPCIPLFRLGNGSVTYVTEEGKNRFILPRDIEGETVTILVSAPADRFEEFLPEVQKVLDSVKWGVS